MYAKIIKQLNELAELLILLYEKLEIIEKAIFMAIQINGKLHGVDLDVHLDEINRTINRDSDKKNSKSSKDRKK